MGQDHRDRRAPAVVEGHEPWRFELPGRRRTVLLARHPRVHCRQGRHGSDQHVERMHQADHSAQPPGRPAPALEGRGVHTGEDPAVQEVDSEAYQLRPVPVWREHGPQHKREIYPAQTEPLATCHQGSQDYRAYKPPKRDAALVHVRSSVRISFDGRSAVAGAFPLRYSPSVSAALMRPMCVNACGKFPRAAPVWGSISSANRPTSFAYASSCSKAWAAAPALPPRATHSTAQKLQIPKAPSPGGSPSSVPVS